MQATWTAARKFVPDFSYRVATALNRLRAWKPHSIRKRSAYSFRSSRGFFARIPFGAMTGFIPFARMSSMRWLES